MEQLGRISKLDRLLKSLVSMLSFDRRGGQGLEEDSVCRFEL